MDWSAVHGPWVLMRRDCAVWKRLGSGAPLCSSQATHVSCARTTAGRTRVQKRFFCQGSYTGHYYVAVTGGGGVEGLVGMTGLA